MTCRATCLLLVGLIGAWACSGDEGAPADAGPDVATPDGAPAESLFGDWNADAASLPDDAPLSDVPGVDQAGPDQALPDAPLAEGAEVTPGDVPAEEVAAPIEWDVLVLTRLKGHIYKDGSYYAQIPSYGTAKPFAAMDGHFATFYSITEDGIARENVSPFFQIQGMPAGVSVIDLSATLTSTGSAVYTIQSNGQVRRNGGHLQNVAPPGGQSFAAIAADGDEWYLVTDAGTVFQKGVLAPAKNVPTTAGDPVVAMRAFKGQLYALTRQGKVTKNGVPVLGLGGQATPPFVALDVNEDHVYTLTQGCEVLADAQVVHTVTPFTGDTCVALALVHAL